MSDTFMLVGEMYGDCPIHDRRGIAWGGVGRDACGCVMLHGGDRLSADDVRKFLADNGGE